MFEEYLEDAYQFFSVADRSSSENKEREARRFYRASVFYASGAMEAFVNYIADTFAQARSIPPHEVCFLNDRVLVFTVNKGLVEKSAYHKVDDKIRLLMKRFVRDFDFQGVTWIKFMEFKDFRDSLVHPRQQEDETELRMYHEVVKTGLKAIIEIMNEISNGIFTRPLRRKLLDLIPE